MSNCYEAAHARHAPGRLRCDAAMMAQLGAFVMARVSDALNRLGVHIINDGDVRHQSGRVAGDAAAHARAGLQDGALAGPGPTLLVPPPTHKLAIVAEAMKYVRIDLHNAQEVLIGQPLVVLEDPVVRFGAAPEDANQAPHWHPRGVRVPAEMAGLLGLELDAPPRLPGERVTVHLPVAGADDHPILVFHCRRQWNAEAGLHGAGANARELRGHIVDQAQVQSAILGVADLPELQQAAAAESEDAIRVRRGEERDLRASSLRRSAHDLCDFHGLRVIGVRVNVPDLDVQSVRALPVRQQNEAPAILLDDPRRQRPVRQEAHLEYRDVRAQPLRRAAVGHQGGPRGVRRVRARPAPYGEPVLVVARGEELAVVLVLAHALDPPRGERLRGAEGHSPGAAVAVHAPHVVDAQRAAGAAVVGFEPAQKRLGIEPCAENSSIAVDQHRLRRVALPHLEDVVSDRVQLVHVPVQIVDVLILASVVQSDEHLRAEAVCRLREVRPRPPLRRRHHLGHVPGDAWDLELGRRSRRHGRDGAQVRGRRRAQRRGGGQLLGRRRGLFRRRRQAIQPVPSFA
mmetsp:Transcript_37090/g.112121  ORF Transcript_37090/g.112121 Transcript_37090/m.112121 type:complete len:571 (-) Transcript_37090:795-2507(-)